MSLAYFHKRFLTLAFMLAAASSAHCGPSHSDEGGGAVTDGSSDAVALLDKTANRAIVKARPRPAGGWIALEEQFAAWGYPVVDPDRRRALVWKESPSGSAREIARFAPEDDHLISDFAVHPSGYVTAVVTGKSPSDNRLIRFDASGHILATSPISDPDLAADPRPFGTFRGISQPLQLRCIMSRIAATVEAVGDDAIVSFETGAHAVVLHRYRLDAGRYVKSWRRLVEPAAYVLAFGGTINLSTFDTGDYEAGAHRAALAVGSNVIAVAVPDSFDGDRIDAHNAFFADGLPAPSYGAVLITRYTFDGTRLGTSVVSSFFESIGRAAAIGDDALYVVGIGGSPGPDGFGLDGRVAAVDTANGQLRWATNIDFRRSDWLMDVAPTKSGHLFVSGMAGFWRNDGGISFGEESESLVAELDGQGRLLRRVAFPARPRNNQVRSVSVSGSALLLGGFSNGPGTHSGDSDLAKITADGEIWSLSITP